MLSLKKRKRAIIEFIVFIFNCIRYFDLYHKFLNDGNKSETHRLGKK
jgi:hypothetical protein